MPPTKLMLVRHGEKQPDAGPPPYGVDADGNADKHSLSVRGWQRAGALVPFFKQRLSPNVDVPDAIYASKVGAVVLMEDGHDVSKSLRPQQTVTPLADALGLASGVQAPFAVSEEAQLVEHLRQHEDGIVLVAWEHHHIPNIATAFNPAAPTTWDGARFDLVWILTRLPDGTYDFAAVAQSLLARDGAV
jgi:broad specificity phosphatase PhoE